MSAPPTALWRRAGEPVAAHDIALALLDRDRYVRTRGVAQQAARAARAMRADRRVRRRLLAAAWLHDVGGHRGPVVAARSLRAAGAEDLARIVAHCGNAPMAAALADLPPVVREFPRPSGDDRRVLAMLDAALVTTRGDGAPGTPADALRDRAGRAAGADPRVRALVALVAHMADDPAARPLVERLARRGA